MGARPRHIPYLSNVRPCRAAIGKFAMSLTIPKALLPVLSSKYPHRPRLLFILRKHPEAGAEAFAKALRDWRRGWEFDVVFGSLVARAGVAMVEEQEAISGRFRAGGTEVTAFDGYVSLDIENYAPSPADFEQLFRLAATCLDALDPVIDRAGTIALAGIANLPIPGSAPLSMLLVLDRPVELTLEEYNAWWVRHADDHRRFNPGQVGYHQLHIATEFNALAASAAGVATMPQCVIDFRCLGSLDDAFPKAGERSVEESRALSADIAAHVSFASVGGSFFTEV